MDRDRRLTGWLRGQVDRPIAPAGFEYSNGWRVRAQPRLGMLQVRRGQGLTCNNTGREELALDTLQCHQLIRPRPSSSLVHFLRRSIMLQILLSEYQFCLHILRL